MADSATNVLKKRIVCLSHGDSGGSTVLYIMSRDQRVCDNSALLAAQKHANALQLPLEVVFLLQTSSGFRAREHFEFMLEGLRGVGAVLAALNIGFEIVSNLDLADRAAIYTDFNPLTGPRRLRDRIASTATCSVYVVDAHNVVPVWVTSDKQEVGARTIRAKIQRNLPEFLIEGEPVSHHVFGNGTDKTVYTKCMSYVCDVTSNGQNLSWKSGEKAANDALRYFIDNRLTNYAEKRNDPANDFQSDLSPYLHFGQLAAVRIALEVGLAADKDKSLQESADVFLEEMIIRRELSDNFCWYNQNYKSINGAPEWAQKTLQKHEIDPREFSYTYTQLENAQTHDPAWNAAQTQLTQHGKMHGYMRMYWAKKVLEWSSTAQVAIDTLIQLNDHYTIDGGDPNGYVGILWSVAGVHDRPWGERPIYGVVRSMVYNGLKRKFDIKKYEEQWLKK